MNQPTQPPADETRPAVTVDPDRDGVILHLPEINYLDTQVWSVDVGLSRAALEALRGALAVPPLPASRLVARTANESTTRHDAATAAGQNLSLVSPSSDRAALLHETADIAESLRQFEPASGARWAAQVSENVGILRVATELRRLANEAEFVATPCAPMVPCEDGGEPCDVHERLMSHHDGSHELCAPNCETADGPRRMAAEEQPAETQAQHVEPSPVCQGFQWIGQSFATCDRCGHPAWDHRGEDVAVEGAGPFDNRRTVRPWKPGEADRIRAKWGTPVGGEQPDTQTREADRG